MRLLRASGYKRMPWKNGGGETIEVMVSPADASFDTFDWRVSMALVGAPGPFSLFPGIDRTLSVISGAGITLTLAGTAPETLDRHSAPFIFRGDGPCDSTLVDGPVEDFNVMTRRSRCRHRVIRHRLTTPATLRWTGDVSLIFAIDTTIGIAAGNESITLEAKNALLLAKGDAAAIVATPQAAGDVLVVEIEFDTLASRGTM